MKLEKTVQNLEGSVWWNTEKYGLVSANSVKLFSPKKGKWDILSGHVDVTIQGVVEGEIGNTGMSDCIPGGWNVYASQFRAELGLFSLVPKQILIELLKESKIIDRRNFNFFEAEKERFEKIRRSS